jgi:nitrite reductase (NO-forming)
MNDHNLTARLWATAAVVAVAIAPLTNVGWWLPVHLAMLGAASQAIVGGQLMFTTTLGLSRGPARSRTVTQLALLNLGAFLVVIGRLGNGSAILAIGASAFVLTVCWVAWDIHTYWRRSINRRFSITGTFYRLAGLSIILGASIGGALALGAFDSADSYIGHKTLHMSLNILGWAGMTIVGTAITLLPTILHVRAPKLDTVRAAPWAMFGGLLVLSTGASVGQEAITAVGMLAYIVGLALFAVHVKRMLVIPRRRRIPTAALHLLAALCWGGVTSVGLLVSFVGGDAVWIRDLLVVGGAGGFVFQALLGAWSFLIPSTRPPDPSRRRTELVAMELGGRSQVVLYNLGLAAIAIGLHTRIDISSFGIALTWCAATLALTKLWTFPLLAGIPAVRALSRRWWAPPEV